MRNTAKLVSFLLMATVCLSAEAQNVLTAPTGNQTVTQPAGTSLSVNNLLVPGTLSISGNLTSMIEQTQTVEMPDNNLTQDTGGILYWDYGLRDGGGSNEPSAYMKIRSVAIFPDYPPYFQTVRGTQLEFGTANGINGWVPATTAMTIDPNGRVGIGTTTPAQLLQLQGGAFLLTSSGSAALNTIQLGNTDSGGTNWQILNGFTATQNLDLYQSGVGSRLTLMGNGNVGIGTTTPAATLEVKGNTQIDGNLAAQSITFPNGAALTQALAATITSNNGNVGIGTPTPNSLLSVGSSSQFQVNGSGAITASSLTNDSPTGASFVYTSGAPTNQASHLFQDTESTAAWMHPASFLASNAAANNHILLSVGTAYNTYDQAYMGLYYVSDGNTNNYGTLGLYNKDDILTWNGNGNVGIGTSTPGSKLEVNGNVKLTSGSGASITFQDSTVQETAWNGTLNGGDYAESVDVSGDRTKYEPGDVIVIDSAVTGKFDKSDVAYSRMVAGVYSTKPGLVGRRTTAARPDREDEVPMAMMGIVPTKVSAENGPIERGDLLVSSNTPGYAMKGTDRDRLTGAVIGKALAPLKSGSGVIEVLVSLQ